MKILVIDNLDSFTFNLVHYLEQFCDEVIVWRKDAVIQEKIDFFDRIVLSPGPGISSEVPILHKIIHKYGKTKPILGVCLGHQAIAEAYGCKLINLKEPSHGKSLKTIVMDHDDYIFRGIGESFYSGRYHSWVIDKQTLPNDLFITSVDEDGEIMSIRHRIHDIRGVQFHPESIMTQNGIRLIENWVRGEM
jgi:anthranilate synthase component II